MQRRLLQRQREKVRERDQALGEATTELQGVRVCECCRTCWWQSLTPRPPPDTKLALAAAEDKVRDLKRALMHRATADAERAQEAADRQELEQEEEAAATAAAQQAEDSTPTRVRVLSVDQRFRKGMTALRAVGGFFGSRRRLAVRRAAADATEAREGGATSSAADRAAGALAEAAAHDKKQRQARRQAESDATAGAATGAGGALSQGGVAAAASPARNDAVSRLRQVVRTVSASQMLYSAQKKKNNATVRQGSTPCSSHSLSHTHTPNVVVTRLYKIRPCLCWVCVASLGLQQPRPLHLRLCRFRHLLKTHQPRAAALRVMPVRQPSERGSGGRVMLMWELRLSQVAVEPTCHGHLTHQLHQQQPVQQAAVQPEVVAVVEAA